VTINKANYIEEIDLFFTNILGHLGLVWCPEAGDFNTFLHQ
jgi:hypothetical protein